MILKTQLIVCVLLGLLLSGAHAQETPIPILIDEFEDVPCGDLLGRTDAFFTDLMKNPDDIGFVSISGATKRSESTRRFIRANIYMRRFEESRLKIIIDAETSRLSTQFWRIPKGAELPQVTEVPEKNNDLSKPFIFGWADDNGVCPSFIPGDFTRLISDNPGSYGRLVVRGGYWNGRKALAEQFRDMILRHKSLSPNRLRIFYIHKPDSYTTEIEFWFIPAARKR